MRAARDPIGLAILLCWVVFFVYWVASAQNVKTTRERQSVGGELAHRIFVWAGVVVLLWTHHRLPALRAVTPLGCAGLGTVMAGLLFALWARQTLGGNWSSAVTLKQGHELITSGPYRLVRNPIYTGMLAMFVGTALDQHRVLAYIAVLPIAIGFWIKIQQEERVLSRHFPDAFAQYRRRVKALVPFLL